MVSVLKRILKVFIALIVLIILALGAYVAYMYATYYRIEDNQALEVTSNAQQQVRQGVAYTALTYNVGFGAYTPDYTFFMDDGILKDGTKIRGSHATCVSKESALAATNGSARLLQTESPDFTFLQEVDINSDRSYHINQADFFTTALAPAGSVFANNYHSSFLAVLPTDMIGFVNSGLLTVSKYSINSAVRRSYPISEGFPEKFVDLDRCFSVTRLPVEGSDHNLVLINNHMSAYDQGGVFRKKQLDLLCQVMSQEAAAGNWVIVGGDWNHALCNSAELYTSNEQVPSWVSSFDASLLPEGFSIVEPTNITEVASCRNNATPYEKGVTYCVTVDGFAVSSNVEAVAQTVDNGFQYSDHNPVRLTFTLR